MQYVVFSIDKFHDIHTLAKFTRFVDTLRASSKLEFEPVPMIGYYEGRYEYSFMMSGKDYDEYVRDSGYVGDQETILIVADDKRMTAAIKDNDFSWMYFKGYLKQVSKEEAHKMDGWTYRPDVGRYYTFVEDVPVLVPIERYYQDA